MNPNASSHAHAMPREEQYVELPGRVTEVLPATTFRVAIQGTDGNVLAHLSGRLRQNHIRVVLNDRVTVAVSVYDPRRGRIVYRH